MPTSRIHCLSAHARTPYTQIPYRVGDVLLFGAETRGLPPEVMESVCPGLGSEVYNLVGTANAVAAFRSAGSTAPAEVRRQIEHWRERLGS